MLLGGVCRLLLVRDRKARLRAPLRRGLHLALGSSLTGGLACVRAPSRRVQRQQLLPGLLGGRARTQRIVRRPLLAREHRGHEPAVVLHGKLFHDFVNNKL